MKEKVFGTLQKIGRSFMLPISILPIAGLFLGIGATLTRPGFIELYHLEAILGDGTFLNNLLTVLTSAGNIIFGYLPLLFAVAVAIGLANSAKEVAALSALLAYFVMYATLTTTIHTFGNIDKLLEINGLIGTSFGFEETMNMGAFGGIIIGAAVAVLHNKYYKIELPTFLSFFEGTRFIPIISAVAAVVLGMILAFVWPLVAAVIASLGSFIAKLGFVGTFIYGYILRALVPLGLHHVFYLPFWQTALGGSMQVGGTLVEGAQNIVFAQLASGEAIAPEAARFFGGNYPIMLFGFPGAALAMYHTAKKENREKVKGLLFSSSFTSFLTGITEPLEFSFLFASPFLYFGIHAVLGGLSFAILHILKAGVGFTFSAGIIDFMLYGVLPGNSVTNWIPVLIVSIIYGFVYYFVFRFFILKFDIKTPGREDDVETDDIKLYSKADYLESKETNISAVIVDALGGRDNLVSLDNCATRLRVSVVDEMKINETILKETGASGILKKGEHIQVIYGGRVANIKTNIDEYLAGQ